MKLLKQFAMMWVYKIRFTVWVIVGMLLLMCLFLAWDARFMSSKEVLECLTRIYGQDFEIVSSRGLSESERAEGVARVKVYEVIPVAEPERRFWAFNVVEAESGGILGMSNGLLETYALDILFEEFAEQAQENGLDYEFAYRSYPGRDSSKYYGYLNIEIEMTGKEEMLWVCRLLAQTFDEVRGRFPADYDYLTGVWFRLSYREPDWPEQKLCFIRLEPFYKLPEGEAALQEYLLEYVANYAERNNLKMLE